jgi:hypothetical protein
MTVRDPSPKGDRNRRDTASAVRGQRPQVTECPARVGGRCEFDRRREVAERSLNHTA